MKNLEFNEMYHQLLILSYLCSRNSQVDCFKYDDTILLKQLKMITTNKILLYVLSISKVFEESSQLHNEVYLSISFPKTPKLQTLILYYNNSPIKSNTQIILPQIYKIAILSHHYPTNPKKQSNPTDL